MKINSRAEANIITEQIFNTLQHQLTLSESKVTLKLYGSPPLAILGQFSATLAANAYTKKRLVYVTSGNVQHNLPSKYRTFDLSVLHITANDDPLQINVHAITQPPDPSDIQHMSYQEMSAVLTPLADSADWLCRNTTSTPKATQQHILAKHKNVFKGIGRHKYRKVNLLINETIDPTTQPQ